MICSELMDQDVAFIREEEAAIDAAKMMRARNIGFLPVCDAERRPVGVITDRDLAIRLVALDKPAKTPVRKTMSDAVILCRANADLQVAERLMTEHRVARIVCVDEAGRLAGVISMTDVAGAENRGRAAQVLKAITARESWKTTEAPRGL